MPSQPSASANAGMPCELGDQPPTAAQFALEEHETASSEAL